MMKTILFLLINIIIISCASTKITAFKDPNYEDIKFKKILIIAPFNDLEYRQITENTFKKSFTRYKINSIESLFLFPPTRKFQENDIIEIISKNEIDAILIIAFSDYWTSESYIPESSRKTGSASIIGNSIYYNERTAKSGGYYISKPRISFQLKLFDYSTGNIAWISSSTTRGNALAKFNTLIYSLANTTVYQLLKDNLLEKKKNN